MYLHHKDGHRVPVYIKVVPIKEGDKIIGAVELFTDNRDKKELEMKVKELKKKNLIDSLTGIGNRRYLEEYLEERLEIFIKYDHCFAFGFIDIDDFKEINDNFGHDVGDRVLKMVSETIKNGVRTFDYICRWGGDEFAVIFTDIDNENDLKTLLNRLCFLIRGSDFYIDGRRVSVTASLGATLAKKSDDIDSIIKRADKLMYRGKRSGKNIAIIG